MVCSAHDHGFRCVRRIFDFFEYIHSLRIRSNDFACDTHSPCNMEPVTHWKTVWANLGIFLLGFVIIRMYFVWLITCRPNNAINWAAFRVLARNRPIPNFIRFGRRRRKSGNLFVLCGLWADKKSKWIENCRRRKESKSKNQIDAINFGEWTKSRSIFQLTVLRWRTSYGGPIAGNRCHYTR